MFILFDIGGTKMRLAVSENGNKLDRVVILPTPRKFDDAMALIKKAIKELANDKKIKAVSGGIAGPLDKNKTMILNAPNLLDWKNKPLAKELQKIFKAPVFLENDAALAGLGEAVFVDGKVWDGVAKNLVYGLDNVTLFWPPDIIILGGSMMKKIGNPVERVKFHL